MQKLRVDKMREESFDNLDWVHSAVVDMSDNLFFNDVEYSIDNIKELLSIKYIQIELLTK